MLQRIFGPMDPASPKWELDRRIMPAVVLGYAILLPRELTFDLAGAAMFPYRLALFALAPFAIGQLARDGWRPSFVDAAAVLTGLWFFIALYNTTTLEAAAITGLSLTFDYVLAYLIGRASIRSSRDVRVIMVWLLPGFAAAGAVIMLESLTHRAWLRTAIAQFLGKSPPLLPSNVRMGLYRAPGPFQHPIIGGVYLASLLPVAWLVMTHSRQRIAATFAVFCSIFTVSAAALMALLMALGLTGTYIVQRYVRLPLLLLIGFYTIMTVIGISLVSESGLLSFISRRLTFDPASGFYRQIIWEYAGAEAMRHPWFGIGQRDWVRPAWMPNSSVDSYWLVLALFYGLPAAIGSLLVIIGSIAACITRRNPTRDYVLAAAGLALVLFVLAFSGLSVHIWESLHAWMYLVCGMAVSLGRPVTTAIAAGPTSAPHRAVVAQP